MEPEENVLQPKSNKKLYVAVWLLLSLNFFLIYNLNFHISFLSVLFFILLSAGGSGALIFLIDKPRNSEKVHNDVAAKVAETMEELRPSCEQIFAVELEEKVRSVVEDASNDFSEGMDWLWQSGEGLKTTLYAGLTQVKNDIKALCGHFPHEEIMHGLKAMDIRVERLLEFINDVVRVQERDREDLEGMTARLVKELETRLSKEKDVVFSYLQNLLTTQITEEFEHTGEMLVPKMDALTEQFRLFLDKSVESKMQKVESNISVKLENMAARVIGEVQSFVMNQINGINQLIELADRVMGERRISSTFVDKLTDMKQQLTQMRDDANGVLMSLAWQDMMVEKRWQELSEKLAQIQDSVADSVDSEVITGIRDNLSLDISGYGKLGNNPALQLACWKLVLAEIMYRALQTGKLSNIIPDGSLPLFQYAAALDQLAEKLINIPVEELKKCKFVQNEVKAGMHDADFDKVRAELSNRKPQLLVYLNNAYPREFLQFCISPYLRQRPGNTRQAAWMLFFRMIDGKYGDDIEIDYLIGLLIASNTLKVAFIHPTKGNQYVKMDDAKYLDDMRSTVIAAFQVFAGKV
ncbi:MAG: hypothetical protein ACM3UZ_11290 [Acidobacteriota bacterium]